MTEYSVTEENNYITLEAFGHANSFYVDKEGNDLVCAIVSTITQVAFLGCKEFTKECNVIKHYSGNFSFKCRSNPNTRAIIYTALLGLREAAKQYPSFLREKGGVDQWTCNMQK